MTSKSQNFDNLEDYWKQIETEFRHSRLKTTDTIRFRVEALTPQNEGRSLPRLHFEDDFEAESADFALGKILGEGGMARVCVAEQLPLHREVAIKMLRAGERSFEMNVRLLQEARLTGLLEHPNIVPIHQLGKDRDGSPLLVMKRIDGVPWSEILAKKKKEPETLSEERASLEWHIQNLIQVCHAVEYAHSKQIIHRDLKPENVMIGEFGEVYVLDWGLAVSLEKKDTEHLPLLGMEVGFCGTPVYMAPEMILDTDDKLDERTDVYLLGATLHELLMEKPPHSGKHLLEIFSHIRESKPHPYPKDIPGELAVICHRAMHVNKEQRYESAGAFRLALQDFLNNQESHKMCAQAYEALEELNGHLSVVSYDSASLPISYRLPDDLDREINRLFWRGHFAFTQALRIWKENQKAKEGLRQLIEAMVHYELSEGDVRAAEVLLTELDEPGEELLRRVEKIRKKQHQKIEHIRELHRNEYEQDVSIGAAKRQVVLTLMGLLLGLTSFIIFVLDYNRIYTPGHHMFLLNDIVFALYVGVAVFFGRDVFLRNQINRKLVKLIVLVAVVFLFSRLLYMRFDVGLYHSVCIDMVILFGCMAFYAVMQNEKLMFAAVSYLAALQGALLWPDFLYAFLGMGHIFSALSLNWSWRRQVEEESLFREREL